MNLGATYMPSSRALVDILAHVTGTPRPRAKGIVRALLNADLLERGKGKRIPEVDGEGVFIALASIAMTDEVVRAPFTMPEACALPLDGEEGGETVAAGFAHHLADRHGWAPTIDFHRAASGYAIVMHGPRLVAGKTVDVTLPYYRVRS